MTTGKLKNIISVLRKYRLVVIIIILTLSSFLVESPYHGNYYGISPYHLYFLITFINLLIYLYPSDKLTLAEKLIYSGIVSFVVLICSGIFIEKVLGFIYGYDRYYGELQTQPLLTNMIFYFFTNLITIGIFSIWLKRKKVIYN